MAHAGGGAIATECFAILIVEVDDQRVADVGEVAADLVETAGADFGFDQCGAQAVAEIYFFDGVITGDSRKFGFAVATGRKRSCDFTIFKFHAVFDQRQISFFGVAEFFLFDSFLVAFFCLCVEDDTAGFPVQPVYRADAGVFFGKCGAHK